MPAIIVLDDQVTFVTDPINPCAGEDFTVTWQEKNIGDEDSLEYQDIFDLDDQGSGDSQELQCDPLTASESARRSLTFNLPAGDYFMTVVINGQVPLTLGNVIIDECLEGVPIRRRGGRYNDTLEANPEDRTPTGLPKAHVAAFGRTLIDYKKGFELAIPAVIHEEKGESPRAIVKADAERDKHPLSEAELDKKMTKLVDNGSFELLPVGKSNENGDDPKTNWIFSVDIDTGTDHGFWASVNRETGEVNVTGFN